MLADPFQYNASLPSSVSSALASTTVFRHRSLNGTIRIRMNSMMMKTVKAQDMGMCAYQVWVSCLLLLG